MSIGGIMKKLLALLLIVSGMQGLMVQANHSYKYLEKLPKDSMLKDKCRWCPKDWVIGYDVETPVAAIGLRV